MTWTKEQIRNLNVIATVISIAVLLVVASMRKIHFETSIDFRFLPAFHSFINACCGVVLILAYIKIRRKEVGPHKNLMSLAMILSFVFLLSYVIYHTTTEEIKYCGEGAMRIIYFAILISHIVLSAILFPFILFTYIRGLTNQHPRHEKLARWVFPGWLYICFSGPVCYLMLKPCM